MATLFVSDLHLDATRPAATKAFLSFLANDAPGADALYILGDLFEYWIDDKDPDSHHREVIAALGKLTATGKQVNIMHGNRDFMLGQHFLQETGASLLYDPTLIYVGGQSVLISHGDSLCTDDLGYQRFRSIVRDRRVQRLYNALPFSLKLRLAAKIRRRSLEKLNLKPPDILDVNQQAVEDTLRKYAVSTLLHGHTHRPAVHNFELDGKTVSRIVLGDWYERGSVLRWDQGGPQLTTISF